MTSFDSMELTRGRKEYDSKVKDLEGIFTKLKNVVDISEYYNRFEQIKSDVANDSSLSNNMGSYNMQMDYEDMALNPYVNRLDDLLKDVNSELLPFYELYLLYSKINIQISEITWENINEIIQNTKALINSLGNLNTHNNKKKDLLIGYAYKTIYSTIMHEEIFGRNDILTYINFLNIPVHRENLGRLLADDLRYLSEKDLIDEDLRTLRIEGLGYDYLNQDIIRKVSQKTVGERNSEYQERKRQAIDSITIKVNNFSERKNHLKSDLSNINDIIRSINFGKSILVTKALAIAMVPIITFTVGNMIGKSSSKRITEYMTITRTIDLNTGKIIGTPEETYDERETTYVATILECGPWRTKPTGGYIQTVTAYEYKIPENIPDDYHISIEDLDNNLIKKYTYDNSKDILEENDSVTESTILVTETYQDKSINRPSTKFIVPFSIAGAILGIIVETALILLHIFSFAETKERLDKLSREIKEKKLDKQEIINRMKQMQEEALQLKDEYNDCVKNFGSFGDEFILPEIDSSFLTRSAKGRIRKIK